MSYTTVVTGTAITASWANANVRDQVLSNFTDTAARDSAILTPTNGLAALLTTPKRLYFHDGSGWRPHSWYSSAGRLGVFLSDAAQSINSAAVTDITWGSEVLDPDNWTSGGSATLTVPSGMDGVYAVSYLGVWAAAAGASQGAQVLINGVASYSCQDGTLWNIPTVSFVRAFAAGDTIKVQVFQNSGGAVNIVSRLEIAYMGP